PAAPVKDAVTGPNPREMVASTRPRTKSVSPVAASARRSVESRQPFGSNPLAPRQRAAPPKYQPLFAFTLAMKRSSFAPPNSDQSFSALALNCCSPNSRHDNPPGNGDSPATSAPQARW